MDRVQLKNLAKNQLRGNWGIAIAALLVVYVLNAAASAAFGIIELVIAGPLSVGLCCIFLGIIRNGKTEFEKILSGFNNFMNNFVVGLLVYVFTFLWSLLLIIPGIIASYAYSMTFFIQHDNPEMRETEAITASKEMMKGHKWELFVLDLSFIGWYLLSCLTFGILLLYVVPYHNATRAAYYEKLSGGVKDEDISFDFNKEENNDDVFEDSTANSGENEVLNLEESNETSVDNNSDETDVG